jgi:hypothetical protein
MHIATCRLTRLNIGLGAISYDQTIGGWNLGIAQHEFNQERVWFADDLRLSGRAHFDCGDNASCSRD